MLEANAGIIKAIANTKTHLPIVGYLGGAPAETLSRASVSKLLEQLEMANIFDLRDLEVNFWRERMAAATANTIFLHAGNAPAKFDVTFNVQLYHYGERIRMGESSGSLHASAGIPVILPTPFLSPTHREAVACYRGSKASLHCSRSTGH